MRDAGQEQVQSNWVAIGTPDSGRCADDGSEPENRKRRHDTLPGFPDFPRAMSTALATAQTRYLRSLAHSLKPVILVGAKGVTPALLAELELALEHHELIKIRLAAPDRDERDAWVAAIVDASRAALVQRVGNIATLFRARRKDPGIILPR